MLLGNYLLTAWRNILRHKLFSAINILGLAIGLAAVMLISLFVQDEISYDAFWQKADHIYRPQFLGEVPGMDVLKFVTMPGLMRDAFIRDFPQVENAVRIMPQFPTWNYESEFFQENVLLVDPEIRNIFDFKVINGTLTNAFDKNTDLVISESTAEKRFGNINPVGMTISINFEQFSRDYEIVAVIKDTPANSMLDFSAIAPLNESDWENTRFFRNWLALANHFYFTLKNGAKIDTINDQMPDFIDRNFIAFENFTDRETSDIIKIKALNIKDLHLNAEGEGELRPKGSMRTVVIFSAVSVLILIIASINFMNLSTARASLRAKEVSLRKVLGANRKHLIVQFLGESALLTLIALLFAIFLVELALPTYNGILGKELVIEYVSFDIMQIILMAVIVGLLSGVYPALVLSGYRPAHILKANKSSESSSSASIRSILVIAQFSFSIALFVSTSVVFGQMIYTNNLDLGYTKENLLLVYTGGRQAVAEKSDFLSSEFKLLPFVTDVTTSNLMPGREGEFIISFRTADMEREESTIINNTEVGYNFFKTYGIELLAGREYDKDRSDIMPSIDDIRAGVGNRGAIIINNSGLRRFGLGEPEEAVGKILYRNAGTPEENLQREYEIIGVVPDVYFDTLKKEIRPEVFRLSEENFALFSIRFSGDPKSAIANIEALWKRELPSVEFSYDHTIDKLSRQYEQEKGQMTIFAAFSMLAILIACLGLFGLASFTAERRGKEIGIRKVFGASNTQIIMFLLWQFSKPVLIANFIAWPVAYFTMSRWLENFAYRIDSIIVLIACLLAGLSALFIAWATVAGNSYIIARQNPIKALRYE